MGHVGLAMTIALGLLVSCESVCACSPPRPSEVVYGRVESAAGTGIPTAVVLYRLAIDTVCVFDAQADHGEIDVGTGGKFRGEIAGDFRPVCLELRAFDPAAGKSDTVSALTLLDFADSTGIVLRLP
jgi:hypothetical protein